MLEINPQTPQEAFELLLAGNQRFVAGTPHHPNQDATRRAEPVSATPRHPHPSRTTIALTVGKRT